MVGPNRHQKKYHYRGAPNCRRLPDRWINYDPVGKEIRGTRFVAFKTPLKSSYFINRGSHFSEEDIFETKTLIEYATAQNKTIGLVIDLTATDRYYEPREWTDRGIAYTKIRCMGHTAHDQESSIRRFFEVVHDFLRNNADNDLLIGVHCTHGLNRTGFMICKYLIEVDGWDAATAIQQFEYCRGYKIERQPYINSLMECKKGAQSYLAVEFRGRHIPCSQNLSNSTPSDLLSYNSSVRRETESLA